VSSLGDDISKAMASVAKDWKKAKRQADKEDRVRSRDLTRMRTYKPPRTSIKDAAYHVMERAYLKASAGGTLPANARQIMYAARPMVLEMIGECWGDSSYFTQTLLPDYMRLHGPRWDVVYDARGHLREPHTGRSLGLGTLEVRGYVGDWGADPEIPKKHELSHLVPTVGPGLRYKYVLFVEKEGFNELWRAVNLSERFDLAIMSTKGMSVTAARRLVDELSGNDVTTLVLRDFDKAGFSIVDTLRRSSRRYMFRNVAKVRDLGFRLEDVEALGLQSEPVTYTRKDPRLNLRRRGATEAECAFLVRGRHGYGGGDWHGERVEINAATSDQLVSWLEGKLENLGRLVPDDDVLEQAYKRALWLRDVQQAVDEANRRYDGTDVVVPDDLREQIEKGLDGAAKSWDRVLWELTEEF